MAAKQNVGTRRLATPAPHSIAGKQQQYGKKVLGLDPATQAA